MAALRIAAAIALLAPSAARADPLARWAAPIAEASSRFDIPEAWIRRVIELESGGREAAGGQPVISRAGAIGLMQLMPGTWNEMRALLGLGSDPSNARENILAGSFYLRLLYDRFGYPGLFAAYNAGPSRYSSFLAGARPLPSETIFYLRRARASGEERQAPSPLFEAEAGRVGRIPAAGPGTPGAADALHPPREPPRLFVTLSADK